MIFCRSCRSRQIEEEKTTIQMNALSKEDTAATLKSQEIDKQLEAERITMYKVQKILILGGPASGKSTIFKQMRIIHMDGFTETDFINIRFLVQANLLQVISQIIHSAEKLNLTIDDHISTSVVFFESHISLPEADINPTLVEAMRNISESSMAQEVISRKEELELLDSAVYFLENMERICDPSYKPTEMDALRSRVPTAGITEIEFSFRGSNLKMVDVGGQRSEQRKWIHCFNNASGILFVTDLASYNMMTDEGDIFVKRKINEVITATEAKEENKLKYSMRLFRRTVNNPCFGQKTAIILFLNKVDVFKEKLQKFPLTVCFQEYKGDQSYEPCASYTQEKFRVLLKKKDDENEKRMYVHFTVATDTKNIDRVFESCIDVVFKMSMEKVGFL